MSTRDNETLEVVLDDATLGPAVTVGALQRERRGTSEAISFAYHRDYLEQRHALALAPQLPLVTGHAWPAQGHALFGIFRDTAPDRWGRMLMERREALEARESRRRVRHLSEWDFLVGVNDFTRMGALRLRQTEPQAFVDDRERSAPPAARLRELEAIARELSRDDAEDRPEYAQWLAQLVAPGTSLGGARPKATYADEDGGLWLAKFPAHDDRRDVGAWEYLAWKLAIAAGVSMPDARLLRFGRGYRTFATQRFDRVRGTRRLYASAMTLLDRNDGDGGSYLDLAQAIQHYGDPTTIVDDLAQLYRRIVFGILIGNRDDHLRNHGFLRTPHGWRLAPAFDINPNPDKREHALAIDANDPSPSVRHLHATHALYRLTATRAGAIEEEVRAAVSDWHTQAIALKLSRTARDQLAAVINEQRD
jgi:serine/threonine-protein kinase HipA